MTETGDINLKRGDVVLCVLSGDYGKPRPAPFLFSPISLIPHMRVLPCAH